MIVKPATEARRVLRHFDSSHVMTDAEIERLVSRAGLSPTPANARPWRFVVVRDLELRKQIRAASGDHAQVTDASLLVIATTTISTGGTDPASKAGVAGLEMAGHLAHSAMRFYIGQDWPQCADTVTSSALATIALMLAAQDLGYQSLPMGDADIDLATVARLINLPDDHVISAFLMVGKAIGEPMPVGGQLLIEDILVRDRFSARSELARSRAIVLERTATLKKHLRAQQTAPKS